MRILEKNALIEVSGGACKYDYNTEKALNELKNQLSSQGLLGSSIEKSITKEIISRATYINCK